MAEGLFDFLVQRVAAEIGIVFLFLDTLSHGFLVPRGEVTGNRFPLLLGFGALQGYDFLHGLKG